MRERANERAVVYRSGGTLRAPSSSPIGREFVKFLVDFRSGKTQLADRTITVDDDASRDRSRSSSTRKQSRFRLADGLRSSRGYAYFFEWPAHVNRAASA